MTDPAITGALEALFASTPPPVTVWGVRYTEPIAGLPVGHIVWCGTETDTRAVLAGLRGCGYPAELVSTTGHVRVHTTTEEN